MAMTCPVSSPASVTCAGAGSRWEWGWRRWTGWAAYLTPLNSGAGPMTMYTMRRYGLPLPVAVTTTFMTFVSTVTFFAIAGPLAVFFGAGRSLGQRGNVLGLSLYDLFLGSLTIIPAIGVVMLVVISF